MTLLTICQGIADEVNALRPDTIIGNTDPDAQKLLRIANKVGTRLMKAFPWQDLRKEQTFTGIAGAEQTGIIPSDFDRFVPETFWNRSSSRLISGPISPVEWQGLKAISYSGYENKFIYRGGSVFIVPDLAGGESLAFEYVSDQWCQSSGGTGQTAWAADTDVGVIDEELMTLGGIYQFLVSESLPVGSAANDYMEMFDRLAENDQPSSRVASVGDIFGNARHFTGTPPVNTSSSSYLLGAY